MAQKKGKKRKKKRGYNQSELVANELAQKLNQDIWTDIIIKKKDNKPQSELNKLERIIVLLIVWILIFYYYSIYIFLLNKCN